MEILCCFQTINFFESWVHLLNLKIQDSEPKTQKNENPHLNIFLQRACRDINGPSKIYFSTWYDEHTILFTLFDFLASLGFCRFRMSASFSCLAANHLSC